MHLQGVYFIHSGLVELRASFILAGTKDKKTNEFGGCFNAIGAGSYFGDVSVICGTHITASVLASTVAMFYHVEVR